MAFRQLQNGPSVAHGKRVLRLDRYRILLTTAYTATEERTGIYGQWPLQRSANTACVLIFIARAGHLRPLLSPARHWRVAEKMALSAMTLMLSHGLGVARSKEMARQFATHYRINMWHIYGRRMRMAAHSPAF